MEDGVACPQAQWAVCEAVCAAVVCAGGKEGGGKFSGSKNVCVRLVCWWYRGGTGEGGLGGT